jgi:DNA mismatch repair protein MutL
VEQGGTTLVRVSDDGEGMPKDDAEACLERHATSKIARLEDLMAIGTFGFRGEALPSIASVSRLLLRTRARGESEALELLVEGGARSPARPAGGAPGTTIEVRDLFFNVPARRKFLKATATESAHIGDVLLGAALSRPDVTFVLTRDGRLVREYLRAGSRAERARNTLAGEKLAECVGQRGAVHIEAMLAPPERARAGATGLSLLVNGRHVRDRLIARAVAQAYGSVLEAGRYPVGVVWIDVPPDIVDVNVHPQKAEVRFADARHIFDAITRELHGTLARAFGLPALGPDAHPWHRPPMRMELPPLRTLEHPAAAAVTAIAELPQTNLFAPEPKARYAELRFVGQVHGTYLLCEGDDALYVIDQHAAAERVTFDRLRRARAARESVAMQRLLVAEVVEVTPSEVALLEENAAEIALLGVEARAVGDAAVAVHGVPALLARAEPGRIVRDLVGELGRVAGRPFGGAIDLVLATMACHGSLRAGDAISREEVTALLRALDEVEFAGHCPHGRPLVMRLAWGELERRVGR